MSSSQETIQAGSQQSFPFLNNHRAHHSLVPRQQSHSPLSQPPANSSKMQPLTPSVSTLASYPLLQMLPSFQLGLSKSPPRLLSGTTVLKATIVLREWSVQLMLLPLAKGPCRLLPNHEVHGSALTIFCCYSEAFKALAAAGPPASAAYPAYGSSAAGGVAASVASVSCLSVTFRWLQLADAVQCPPRLRRRF